jgi:hypothetical protein
MNEIYAFVDKDGNISGVSARRQTDKQEIFDADDPKVIAFNDRRKDSKKYEALIKKKMRDIALDALKTEGEIPDEYV